MGSSDLEHSALSSEIRPGGRAASPRQLARIVGTAVVGALAVVTIGLVLAVWGLGLSGKISQSTDEVLDLVKLGFALVAGVGGTVGLVLAYQRHLIAVEAGQREHAKEAREDTKLFNERFAAAAGQIASEQYAMKLAGVYAMGKLADDWDEGRQTCINVLCANLRRGYTPKPPDDGDSADLLAFNDNREIRHTIIAVIVARLRDEDSRWHGSNFDFHGAVFDGGDFTRAMFSAGTFDFRFATFSGPVDFREAVFSGGSVLFNHATFSSRAVLFSSAVFAGGNVSFVQAAFSGAFVAFSNSTFSGATVEFASAVFSGGNVGFERTRFSAGTVDFSAGRYPGYGAKFSGSTVDFSKAVFCGGTVNFRAHNMSVPPRFDFPLDKPPVGVLLPALKADPD